MLTLTRFFIAAVVSLPLTVVSMKQSAPTGERLKVAGTFSVKYVKQEVLAVGGTDGHILVLAEARGPNHSTGRDVYMDGAEVVNQEIGDLTQGNGANNGYLVFSQHGEASYTRWTGRVTTTLTDGNPNSTLEGAWTKVGGTGRYDGVTGSGTYTGRMISPAEYVVDWQGELVLKENTAIR